MPEGTKYVNKVVYGSKTLIDLTATRFLRTSYWRVLRPMTRAARLSPESAPLMWILRTLPLLWRNCCLARLPMPEEPN